jgi:hypothetical protein
MFPSLLPSLVLALAPATALFASASLADASPPSATAISIVHRYLPASPSSDAPLPAWTPRLTVHLDQPAAGDGRPATVSRVEELEGTELPGAEGWYQVALDGGRSFTSVRAVRPASLPFAPSLTRPLLAERTTCTAMFSSGPLCSSSSTS